MSSLFYMLLLSLTFKINLIICFLFFVLRQSHSVAQTGMALLFSTQVSILQVILLLQLPSAGIISMSHHDSNSLLLCIIPFIFPQKSHLQLPQHIT